MCPSPSLLSLLLGLPHTLSQRFLLFVAEPTGHSALSSPLGLGRLLPEPAAQLVRQPQDAATDGGAIAAVLALAARLGDLLGKVPQLAVGAEGTRPCISGWSPGGVELDPWGDLWVFGFHNVEELILLEAEVRVLEGLLVDSFEIREITLVEQGLAELHQQLVNLPNQKQGPLMMEGNGNSPVEHCCTPCSVRSKSLHSGLGEA